jgi:hypothetical protein
MTTTIAPSAGQTADFLQLGPGASASYGAIDLRRALGAGLQEGVVGTNGGAYKVTLSSGMILTIAASTADGALVQGDTIAAQGLYFVPPHSAAILETVTAAHATLPRIDMVVLEVLDANHDGGGSNLARTRIIAGTATGGATLDNRTGAAALPNTCLLLADVLVPAAAASILAANIRDRRRWASGAFNTITRTSNAAAGNDYTLAINTGLVVIDSTNIRKRYECSGVPVRITLSGSMFLSASNANAALSFLVDSAVVTGAASGVSEHFSQAGASAGATYLGFHYSYIYTPSAASHLIEPGYMSSTASNALRAQAASGLTFAVEEIVRQRVDNA